MRMITTADTSAKAPTTTPIPRYGDMKTSHAAATTPKLSPRSSPSVAMRIWRSCRARCASMSSTDTAAASACQSFERSFQSEPGFSFTSFLQQGAQQLARAGAANGDGIRRESQRVRDFARRESFEQQDGHFAIRNGQRAHDGHQPPPFVTLDGKFLVRRRAVGEVIGNFDLRRAPHRATDVRSDTV